MGQTPKEVLARIQQSHELINNVQIESEWVCTFLGRSNTWEDQSFVWDDLGRRRVKTETGPIDSNRARQSSGDPHITDTIFDGEIVAYAQYYPERDRVGNPSTTDDTGYYPVIIGDATAPLKKDLEGHRNPFEYIRNVAIWDIREAIASRRITSKKNTANDLIEVRVEYVPGPDLPDAYSIISVDPKKNWSIVSLKTFDKKDVVTQEITYQYSGQEDGLWVPVSGKHVRWALSGEKKGQPVFDWSFRVKHAIYNDPDFDETVFAVRLPPDAAVSDTRYDVAYRIGEKEAHNSDLEKLASQAKQEEENEIRALADGDEFRKKSGPWKTIVILVNVAILAIVIGIFVYRRQK